MNCREIELIIDEYAAGELSPEKAKTVAAHLAACEACGKVEAQYRAAMSALSEAGREAPAADVAFYRGLARRLDDVDRYAGRSKVPPIRWHFVGSVAAAAAAVLILTVYVIPNMYGPAPRTESATEPVAVAVPGQYDAHATPVNVAVMPVSTDGTQLASNSMYAGGQAVPAFVFPSYPTRIYAPQQAANAATRDDFRRLEERLKAVEVRLTALEQGHSTNHE